MSRVKNQYLPTRSLLTARGLFSFGQLVVPSIVAQTQLAWEGFGFPDADLTTLVQEFLNERIIRSFFWDMFHAHRYTRSVAFVSRTIWLKIAQVAHHSAEPVVLHHARIELVALEGGIYELAGSSTEEIAT